MIGVVLLWGLVTSIAFSVVVLGSWYLKPELFLSDVTQRQVNPPVTPALICGFVAVIAVVAGGAFAGAWHASGSYDATFVERFLVAWGVMLFLNLFDFIVLDVLIYMKIYPSWMAFDDHPPLHEYGPHAFGVLQGMAMGFPVSLLIAVLTG